MMYAFGKMVKRLDEVVYNLIHWGFERYGKYYSVYRAVVTDNQDPSNQGRLRLYIPQVHGNDTTSDYWAYPKGVFSGKGYGIHIIPKVADTVWVEFEQGDPSVPVWSLGHFGINEIIEPNLANTKNYWFRTPGGHLIQIDDNLNSVSIAHSRGHSISLNEENISVGGFGTSIVLNAESLSVDFQGTSTFVVSANLVRLSRLSQSIFIDQGGISVASGGGIFIGNPNSTLNPVGQLLPLGEDTQLIFTDIATILDNLADALNKLSTGINEAAAINSQLSPLVDAAVELQLAMVQAKADIALLDPSIFINLSENISTT